jgi:hypothetical protein
MEKAEKELTLGNNIFIIVRRLKYELVRTFTTNF